MDLKVQLNPININLIVYKKYMKNTEYLDDNKKFDKTQKLFESFKSPSTSKSGSKVEHVQRDGRITYGIIREKSDYVIKITESTNSNLVAEDFKDIPTKDRKRQFHKSTLQEAIKYTQLLINEARYVLKIPAPQAPAQTEPPMDQNMDAPSDDSMDSSGDMPNDQTNDGGGDMNSSDTAPTEDGEDDGIDSLTGKLTADIRKEIQNDNEEITVGAFKSILAAAKNLNADNKKEILDKAEDVLKPKDDTENGDQQQTPNNDEKPVNEEAGLGFSDKPEFEALMQISRKLQSWFPNSGGVLLNHDYSIENVNNIFRKMFDLTIDGFNFTLDLRYNYQSKNCKRGFYILQNNKTLSKKCISDNSSMFDEVTNFLLSFQPQSRLNEANESDFDAKMTRAKADFDLKDPNAKERREALEKKAKKEEDKINNAVEKGKRARFISPSSGAVETDLQKKLRLNRLKKDAEEDQKEFLDKISHITNQEGIVVKSSPVVENGHNPNKANANPQNIFQYKWGTSIDIKGAKTICYVFYQSQEDIDNLPFSLYVINKEDKEEFWNTRKPAPITNLNTLSKDDEKSLKRRARNMRMDDEIGVYWVGLKDFLEPIALWDKLLGIKNDYPLIWGKDTSHLKNYLKTNPHVVERYKEKRFDPKFLKYFEKVQTDGRDPIRISAELDPVEYAMGMNQMAVYNNDEDAKGNYTEFQKTNTNIDVAVSQVGKYIKLNANFLETDDEMFSDNEIENMEKKNQKKNKK